MPERRGPRSFARELRRKLHTDLHERLIPLQESVTDLQERLSRAEAENHLLRARVETAARDAQRAAAIGRHIHDQEADNRRRLHALRASEAYEAAFTEPEPLVSFLVPTYNSWRTLRDVALPSILGQSHSNLEVIVVGDCAPPETGEAVASIGDSRVTYVNRTIRGPYPEDTSQRWWVVGSPPVNDALALARGRWIGALGDDDAVRPTHTEHLLAAAREHRWEHCYGLQEVHFGEGGPITLGSFPPVLGQWGMQAAIYHAGLRFFESELTDAIYEEPNDWSKCRRMMRAGVRFGMIDEVVADKHERRRRSAREWMEGRVPIAE